MVRHHHYRRGSRGRAGIHSLDAELVQRRHGLTLKDTSYRLFSPILTGFAFDVFLFKEITYCLVRKSLQPHVHHLRNHFLFFLVFDEIISVFRKVISTGVQSGIATSEKDKPSD